MNNTDINYDTYRDFWAFISEYLPGYSWRSDVLESDILCRYVFGEEVWEEDLKWINQYYGGDRQRVIEALTDLEAKLTKEALTEFYEQASMK